MKSAIGKTLLVGALALGGTAGVGIGLDATGATSTTARAQVASAGSVFVPIDPYRALDTRIEPDASPLSVTNGSASIVVTADVDLEGNQVVPDEATAVTYNITAADTTGAGFFQVTTGNRELGNTSTVNWWSNGQAIANSGVIALFESDDFNEELENTFLIFIGGADGSSAHAIIDITGYYLES